jgi:hypothetical protein
MTVTIVQYRDWKFEVDRELTRHTYESVSASGAESCACNDCKNYVACRDKIFPEEIKTLFSDLGIDYSKEVEITPWETLPGGLHHIGGWFHFKGRLLSGKDCRDAIPGGAGYTF